MATTLKIKNLPTGYQTLINNGRHAIVGDEPIKSKGTDLGFSPPEFLLAGISMCKVATIRNVARRNDWEIGEVNAEISLKPVKQKDGSFKTKVLSNITIEGNITEEQYNHLVEEGDNCYITRLVRGEWTFEPSNALEPVAS